MSPTDNYATFGLSMLADVVAELDDRSLAVPLLARLSPYVELNGMGPPEISSGPIARPVALLEDMLDRVDESEQHFVDAIDRARAMGARPWLAHSLHEYARMLARHAGTDDDEHVDALLDEAATIGRELGMQDLLQRLAGDGDRPATLDGGEQAFRREGEYWTVTYGRRSVRLKDSKGNRYLAALLAAPGRDIAAVDLAVMGTAEGATAGARGSAADGGDVLDSQSRAAYRRRIEELQAEIDEAQSWNDPERAARAEEELDALVEQLAAATGLGGRDRTFGSDAERARQRVKKAISASLGRINSEHPELGDHLARTIRTGFYCRYDPDPRTAAPWRT